MENIKNINHRPNWTEYFMSIALLASKRSACERLQVGCVLVKDNHLIATGYNGFLPKASHKSVVRDNHEQMTTHAEQNAIADCAKRGVSTVDSTAFITHYPCIICFKILAAAGIKKIIYHEDYKNDELVKDLALEVGIIIHKYRDI